MASGSSAPLGGVAARRAARQILAEPRFHASPVPKPLHGALEDIGNALDAPLKLVERLVNDVGASLPGGSATAWSLLALLVVAASIVVASTPARRHLRPRVVAASKDPTAPVPATPDELERAASTAEHAGHYREAIGLRFRAGLLRLAERELVVAAPRMLNGDIARALDSSRFDSLAKSFDAVAYGGVSADARDAEQARLDWSVLLEETSR